MKASFRHRCRTAPWHGRAGRAAAHGGIQKHDTFPPDRASYFAQSATWSEDILGGLRASRRRAYIVQPQLSWCRAGTGALMALAPLKATVPYTITVDPKPLCRNRTDFTAWRLAQDEAVMTLFWRNMSWHGKVSTPPICKPNMTRLPLGPLGQRVTIYRWHAARQSSKPRQSLHLGMLKSPSRASPCSARAAHLYGRYARVGDGPPSLERRSYAAAITFRFTGQPMRNEDRFQNPLGFQVVQYRRDAEFAELRASAP